MDSLSALGVFVRAAEARSFTEAGRRLSVSSSAVGKTISRLEDRLGVRLFHRNTRAITLTPEGELFLESCRRIFSELNRIELQLSQSKAKPEGRFKVSVPAIGTLMVPALHGFMREYPEIQLDVEFTDNLVEVIDGGYDAVIRSEEEQTDSRLISRRVGSYRLEIVGSPSYLERHGIPATPDALLSRPCLHRKYPTSGKLQRWPFARCGPYADLRLPVTAVVTTIAPLVSLAELGIGLACVPNFAVHAQIASGSLVKVLDEYVEHSGVFRAMWPASQHSSPKLRAFVDYMAENLFPKGPLQDDRRAEAPERIADRDPSTGGFEAAKSPAHPT